MFGYAERALLSAQEVLSGFDECLFRYETDYLCTGDTYATFPGGAAHFLECYMKGSGRGIGDVHGHLRDSIFIDKPSDSFGTFECTGYHHRLSIGIFDQFAGELAAFAGGAAFLADVEGDGICSTCRCGVEIEVDGYEEVAGAYGCGPGTSCRFVERPIAKVGRFARSIHFLG